MFFIIEVKNAVMVGPQQVSEVILIWSVLYSLFGVSFFRGYPYLECPLFLIWSVLYLEVILIWSVLYSEVSLYLSGWNTFLELEITAGH